jgi:hypothetical protein
MRAEKYSQLQFTRVRRSEILGVSDVRLSRKVALGDNRKVARRQKGGATDRIRLIEITEAHTARLSAEGTESWEELEFLREAIPDPEEPTRMAREYDIMERIFELPLSQQFITGRLAELVGGLRAAEEAKRRGEDGDGHRARGVIYAAMLKDREEGRPIHQPRSDNNAAGIPH